MNNKIGSSSYPPGGLVLIPNPVTPALDAAYAVVSVFGFSVVTFIAAAIVYIAATGF